MKRFFLIAILTVFAFSFSACNKIIIEGEPAWKIFSDALENTSALEFYSIETQIKKNDNILSGKLVYTTLDDGNLCAYKKEGNVESWWYKGLCYFENKSIKLKKAQSLNSFLNNNSVNISWNYDMVQNIKAREQDVSFDVFVNESNKYIVSAKVAETFLEEITVEKIEKNGDSANNSIISYRYINPGKKPSVKLPDDLEDYVY